MGYIPNQLNMIWVGATRDILWYSHLSALELWKDCDHPLNFVGYWLQHPSGNERPQACWKIHHLVR